MVDYCAKFFPFIKIIVYVIKYICYIVPVVLIVMVTVDILKNIINSDEKNTSRVMQTSFKRALYAVIVFLVPILVRMVFSLAGNSLNYDDYVGSKNWVQCFYSAMNEG